MSDRGNIIAQVYTARMAIPLPDVSVTFLSAGTDRPQLIAHRVSNSVGKTEPVFFDTPDLIISQEPVNSGVKPYALCDMRFDMDDYYSILVKDVQIFPDTESIQRLEMFPLPEYSNNMNNSITLIVISQDL